MIRNIVLNILKRWGWIEDAQVPNASPTAIVRFPVAPMEAECVDAREAMAILDVSINNLRHMVHNRRLPIYTKRQGRNYFLKSDVLALKIDRENSAHVKGYARSLEEKAASLRPVLNIEQQEAFTLPQVAIHLRIPYHVVLEAADRGYLITFKAYGKPRKATRTSVELYRQEYMSNVIEYPSHTRVGARS